MEAPENATLQRIRVPMDYVRRQVKTLLPFLSLSCDIDYALAYAALERTYGLWVRFPKKVGQGVIIGTSKRQGLKAPRSHVSFEWVWLGTRL